MIICGTDFSPHAERAIQVAGRLAVRLDELLQLVHAMGRHGSGEPDAGLTEAEVAAVRTRLGAEADQLRQAGARVDAELHVGSPSAALMDAARTAQARLLVVGGGGTSQRPLGGTAHRIVQEAPCPVLVVREAGAFLEALDSTRPLRVVIGIDLGESAAGAAAWLADLRRAIPCQVTAASIAWPDHEHRRLGLPEREDGLLHPEAERVLRRELEQQAAPLATAGEVAYALRAASGRVDRALIDLAAETRADLLVVGMRTYADHLLPYRGATSRGVVEQASMGVACVPLPARDHDAATAIPRIRRVLVATDFSPAAHRALPIAYALAPRGATVHLLHVVEPPPNLVQRIAAGLDNLPPRPRDHAVLAEELRGLVPRLAAERGIASQVEVSEHDSVAEGICAAAERAGADIICIGHQGRTGLAAAMAGGTAQRVLAISRRPVVVVRAPLL